MRNNKGQFVAGRPAENRYPVGAVRIRTRRNRGGEKRAFIKTAEPNVWILRARHIWTRAYGPIPPGMGLHHRDGDKLNDVIENLELVSKSEHLAIHRPEHHGRAIAGLVAARKARRWSTKSTAKRTGRHPKDCTCPIHVGHSSRCPSSP
jgi:hypothetical protein